MQNQYEPHLWNDQRWRFENLGKMVTEMTTHALRGKNEHILTAIELEKDQHLFEFAPLVDIGPKLPYMTNKWRVQYVRDLPHRMLHSLLWQHLCLNPSWSVFERKWELSRSIKTSSRPRLGFHHPNGMYNFFCEVISE